MMVDSIELVGLMVSVALCSRFHFFQRISSFLLAQDLFSCDFRRRVTRRDGKLITHTQDCSNVM